MNTKPNRQTIRLKQHDYTSGCSYFITICTHNRSHLFGEIVDGVAMLNDTGKMAYQCWSQIPNHFSNVKIGNFIIMPNHIHGIIHIHPTTHVGANHHSPVSVTTDNQTIFSNSCTIDTLQLQNINKRPDVNDLGDSYKNNVGCYSRDSWANDDAVEKMRANDDSLGIRRANDDSPLRNRRWENGTSNSVGSIVRGFKIGVTKFVRERNPEFIVWQRNYWEHIIRDNNQLYRIQQYVINNPQKWYLDKLNGGYGNQVLESSQNYGCESWMV